MGEFELLARLRERLAQARGRVLLGSGDDAAVTAPGGATATSIDAMVDGIHFRREWSSLAQIGAKALATALSDLAAMGATPGEAYVALELLDGLAALAATTDTALAGGDVTRAPALSLTIAVVGHAPSAEDLVTRSGARPGDAVVVTGELGGAAAGLLLLDPATDVSLHLPVDKAGKCKLTRLIERQLEPQARLAAGQALAGAGATAMIDLSDGLGGDAHHIAAASGVGLRIDAAALPIARGVAEVARATGTDPLELVVSGGEDYELLATLPPERVDEAAVAVAEGGLALTRVGEVVADEGVEVRLPDGRVSSPRGFDQLG